MAMPIVAAVANKLADYLRQEACLLYGVRDEVEGLERELRAMLCFLKDADSKRKGNDQRVKNWVKDVRELAFHVEDVIETFVLKVGRPSSIHRYTSAVTSTIPRYKVGKKIEKIKARISKISAQRAAYSIVNLGENRGEESCFVDENMQARRRLSPHHYDDSSIVGLENDKEMILRQLLNAKKRLCVISVVGMGGLGKTTLAKKVYNSREVRAEFQFRAWVSVSQNYIVTELLKEIIKSIVGKEDTEHMKEEDLKEKVYELLMNQGKYLIVMDDVWRKEMWERVATALPDTENGSRVMFTTQLKDVAKRADPAMDPYELQLLDKTESQKLFLKKVFPDEDVRTFPHALEDIGETLVSKCHGLPVALVVLGGLLSIKEKNHHEWLRVLNSSDWQSTEGCRAILSLSYEDLPYELKPCFLYIGSFPEDSEIDTEILIGLWMAEGFIPQRSQKTREETARDFLDELVQRCMVQVAYRRGYDVIVLSIRIHDLLRDLCLDEAKEDGFMMVKNGIQVDDASTSSDVMSARRWVLRGHRHFADINCSIKHMRRKNLHTLLGFNLAGQYDVISKTIDQVLDGTKLLRVIHIEIDQSEHPGTIILPKEITTMIHLRYLRWTIRNISASVVLPSIQNLLCLQTLNIPGLIVRTKDGIGNLTDLQALQGIEAGRWIETDLPKLTNLQKLGIVEIKNSQGKTLAKSLGKLDRLEELHLCGELNIPVEVLVALPSVHRLRVLTLNGKPSVLSNSCFPPSLTKLTLERTRLDENTIPVLEKLPNLIHLLLGELSYVERSMNCSIGGFPRLLRLVLSHLPKLEKWRVEAGAMPRLTHLSIHACEKLKVTPEGLQHVTTLRELHLWDMPNELRDRVRENEGEDWYKVRCIPSIIIR